MEKNKLLDEYQGDVPKNPGCAFCRNGISDISPGEESCCLMSYKVIFDPVYGLKKEYKKCSIKNKNGQCTQFDPYRKCAWCEKEESHMFRNHGPLCGDCKREREKQREEKEQQKKK